MHAYVRQGFWFFPLNIARNWIVYVVLELVAGGGALGFGYQYVVDSWDDVGNPN